MFGCIKYKCLKLKCYCYYAIRIVVVNWSIFTPAIKQYEIPLGVKLPKMANLYMGTTSPSEHPDNYAMHVALNLNHDALKYRLFEITLGSHAQT